MEKLKISQMRNLGAAMEQYLNQAGIFYAHEVVELGTYKTFEKMLFSLALTKTASKHLHAAYLYAIYGAIHDIDWRYIPEDKKKELKAYTAALKKEARFC